MNDTEMHRWLLHHMDALLGIGLVFAGVVLTFILRRVWLLLLPLPVVLALLTWYGWEFSSEGAPLAFAIAALGYMGLAGGLVLAKVVRR